MNHHLFRRAGRTAAAAAAAACALTACSSSHGSSHAGSTIIPPSGTLPHGTVVVPTTAAASTTPSSVSLGGTATTAPAGSASPSSPSTVVTVPGSGSYVLSLDPAPGQTPCANPGVGGSAFGFTVAITNPGSASEPLARVAVTASDPSGSRRPVAALSYSGLCIDFTEPGGTLSPGQSVTYHGSVSGATPTTVLTAKVISTPQNYDLGSVQITVGGH